MIVKKKDKTITMKNCHKNPVYLSFFSSSLIWLKILISRLWMGTGMNPQTSDAFADLSTVKTREELVV